MHQLRRTVGGALLATALAGALTGGPPAIAQDTVSPEQRHQCQGPSPRFGEVYKVQISATQTVESYVGEDVNLLVQHSKTYQAPFAVSGTITWKNEATGARGSQAVNTTTQRWQLFTPNVSTATALIIKPGRGPLTVTAALQPAGAPQLTCTANFQVR